MSAMQKLKAYFGMIPADEVDGYAEDYPEYRPTPRYDREYTEDFEEYEPPALRRRYPRDDYAEDFEPAPQRRNWQPPRPAPAPAPTRGALAVDPRPEPVTRIRPAAMPQQLPAEPPPREISLSKITTLHLHSYHEARMIGEPYRDGIPVIMNLTEMDDADARRLVDFAAGLAFATRGDIDKITTKVFLVAPPNIDVTAEDKKRLAEGGYYARR